MKKNFYILIARLGALAVICGSCKYQQVVPNNYPDQKLYMSNASIANQLTAGIYNINSVDVPGQVSKYTLNTSPAKLNALFGVVRSGISMDGDVTVNLTASTDTISKLITSGTLAGTDVLPASAYTLVPNVSIAGGQTSVTFPLVIDLNFLIANPAKKYGIAVSIKSDQRSITPLLGTTIMVIDDKFLFPTASFTSAPDAAGSKKINFNNTSANGLTYSWDFGDGSAAVTDKSPSHTYVASGTYPVKLTVTGVTGDAQKTQVQLMVTVI